MLNNAASGAVLIAAESNSNRLVVTAFVLRHVGEVIPLDQMFCRLLCCQSSQLHRDQGSFVRFAAEVAMINLIETSVYQNPLGSLLFIVQ